MHKQSGLTLPELLAAMGILAILGAAGSAGLDRLLANARMNSATNEWVHRVHQARHAALSRSAEVVLCPSRDGRQCAGDNDWTSGWLMFVNHQGHNPPRVDDDEYLIAADPTPGPLRITANRTAFVMRPFGRRATNGTVLLCDPHGRTEARAVIISYTGKPRASRVNSSGGALTCPTST